MGLIARRGLILASVIGAAALPFVACVGDDPSSGGTTSDASTESDVATTPDVNATGDTGTPPNDAGAGPCNLKEQFMAPVIVPGLGSIGTLARMSADETVAYFSVAMDGGHPHLFSATRPTMTGTFGTPVGYTSLNTSVGENFPTVSTNGLLLIYSSTNPDGGVGMSDLWQATRTNPANNFIGTGVVPGIDTTLVDDEAFLTADTELWFESTRSTTNNEIFRAASNGSGGFVSPAPVIELNSTTDDNLYPTLSADKLAIFFARSGADTQSGSLDIWTATRASASDPFGTPASVTELNTMNDERPAAISADKCRLYFATGTTGALTEYVASRPAN